MSHLPEPRPESTRLNRYLAECGLGARRKVEELILSGRIAIDGKKSTQPGTKVMPGQEVAFDGQPLSRIRKRYFILNKPRGFVCAVSDKHDRTVFDLLDFSLRKLGLFPVGRLDKESEGLLLLTNDGELAQKFTHPSGKVIKRYDIRLERSLLPQDLEKWDQGTFVEGKWVKPVSVEFPKDREGKDWLRVFLREGRKRELRVMAETHGFKVIRLVRTAIGRLEIGSLRLGETREVTREELLDLTGIGGN